MTLILGLTGAFCWATNPAVAADPEAELAAMRVADGYEVNLFASEKEHVVKPIQIRFDPQGRLWMVGSTVYPQIEPGQVPDDKVVMLEDTDGDGRADRSTIFADGLMIPTGIELGDGGVYVGQTTQLLHLKDTDGDGKADQRRVILRGFGTGDSHQTINSFTWGPGGEMMMCQGLHAFSRVETPWGIERLDSAGVWRFYPRLLRLDPFLHREMGPQNPFGIAFDRWGQPIMIAGNGQGIYYLTPAMIRAEHHLTLRALWSTGRKFGGGDFVENSHFPAEAQGELISGNYINNAVFRFRVTDHNAGFKVEDLPPLITSTDKSFRIVDVRFGPDGALYLCDWYNPIIGHYQASFRHPDRDKTRGRIWRVTAKGRKLVSRPQLGAASVNDLLEQLKSPERWNRQMAKRRLADLPASEVTHALAGWIQRLNPEDPGYEHQLFEALGVYESQETIAPELLERLLRAKDGRARAYATRVLARWQNGLPDVLHWLAVQAEDPHPRVRLEAVVAASYIPRAGALEAALRVVDRPLDAFIEYALVQTIHTLKPHWRDAFVKGELDLSAHPARLEHLVKTDASSDTLQVLLARLKLPGLPAELRERFLRILAETGRPDDLTLLLEPASYEVNGMYDPEMHARLLPALAVAHQVRKTQPAGDLAEALRRLIRSDNPRLSAEAIQLAGRYRIKELRTEIERIALDDSSGEQRRRGAAFAIAAYGLEQGGELLQRLAADSSPDPVRAAAIAGLASRDLRQAATAASQLLASAKEASAVDEVFTVFLQRRGGADALVEAIRSSPPNPETAEAGLRLMNATGRRHAELAAFLADAAGLKVHDLSPGALDVLIAEVQTQGDSRRGAAVYERAELGCVQCHAIGGRGGDIGPDLGALGTAQTTEFIIGALLFPNKEVKEGYMSVEMVTKDGETFQGYVVREDRNEVVLRDLLHKAEVRVARDRIQSRKQHGSLMPSGLVDTLTRAEFRDLVRFLSELGRN